MFEGILILEEFIDEESLSNPPPPIYRNKLRPGFFDNFTAEVQILFFRPIIITLFGHAEQKNTPMAK